MILPEITNGNPSWLKILPSLGVEIRGGVLPARVICPLCRSGVMTVHADPTARQEWYHCGDCRFAGDAEALTAAAKGEPGGTPDPNAKFWRGCHSPCEAHDTAEFTDLLHRFGLDIGRIGGDAWRAGIGRFIGVSTRKAVEAAFYAGGLEYTKSLGRETVCGIDHPFQGAGWGPLIVIPFHDLPGRVRGFLLVGRQGRPCDFVYKRVVEISSRHQERFEAGYALFDAGVGEGVVVVTGVEEAIRLQGRHLQDHSEPLRLIGAIESEKYRTRLGASTIGETLVFLGPAGDLVTIAQARSANGLVAKPGADDGQLPPSAVVEAAIKGAKPWQAVLERSLIKLKPKAAEVAVASLGMAKEELVSFVGGCAVATQTKLKGLLTPRVGPITVTVGKYLLRQTDEGWFAKNEEQRKREFLVTDAPFQVDKVIALKRAGRVVYQGRIRYRGKEVPFTAPDKEFESDPLTWTRKHLQREGAGVAVVNSLFRASALAAAHQIHPPESAVALESVGWDEESASFQFPSYCQHVAGEVSKPAYVALSEAFVPCVGFEPPDGLTRLEIAAMSARSPATAVFWAVAAHVLAEAVSVPLRAAQTRLALVGPGGWTAGYDAALALGCIKLEQSGREPEEKWLARAEEICTAHRWPSAVNYHRGRHRGLSMGFQVDLPVGSVSPATRISATSLQLLGGWRIVRCDDPLTAGGRAASVGNRVVPNYLADLCGRRLVMNPGATLLARVLADMADWVGRIGGDRKAVLDASGLMTSEDPALFGHAFVQAATYAMDSYDVPRADERAYGADNSLPAVIYRSDGGVFVPREAIDIHFKINKAQGPDPAYVSERLRACGLLLADGRHHGRKGWVVPISWWADRYREQETGSPKFGVV